MADLIKKKDLIYKEFMIKMKKIYNALVSVGLISLALFAAGCDKNKKEGGVQKIRVAHTN